MERTEWIETIRKAATLRERLETSPELRITLDPREDEQTAARLLGGLLAPRGVLSMRPDGQELLFVPHEFPRPWIKLCSYCINVGTQLDPFTLAPFCARHLCPTVGSAIPLPHATPTPGENCCIDCVDTPARQLLYAQRRPLALHCMKLSVDRLREVHAVVAECEPDHPFSEHADGVRFDFINLRSDTVKRIRELVTPPVSLPRPSLPPPPRVPRPLRMRYECEDFSCHMAFSTTARLEEHVRRYHVDEE